MYVPQSLRLLGAGITLAALVAFLAVGARAAQSIRVPEVPVSELRSLADHYPGVTWTYQRAARQRRTPTSFSYRRSADRDYLRWTIDEWTRRAYVARERAVTSIHH